MPAGLQVWDAGGILQLDTPTLLGRIFGQINVGAGQASGTIVDARFLDGQGFLIGMFSLGDFSGAADNVGPSFSQLSYSLSGNTALWSRQTNMRESNLPAGIIYYGAF